MAQFVKVCRKEMTTKDGRKFFAYFGYATDADGNNVSDKSFRIRLCNNALDMLKNKPNENKYPFIVSLEKDDYFVTIDRYVGTKQPKLDKDGKECSILVIKNLSTCKKAPRRTLDIKDLI